MEKISESSRILILVENLRFCWRSFLDFCVKSKNHFDLVTNSWLHNYPSTVQCKATAFLLFHFQIGLKKKEKRKVVCALSSALRSVLKALRRRRRKKITGANVNGRINPAPPPFLFLVSCLNFPCLASLLLRVLFLEAAVYFEARSGESQRS